MPRGGARPGAGRKPKSAAAAKLHGSRQRTVVQFPGTTQEPVSAGEASVACELVPLPRGLSAGAKSVWKQLAPFAETAGTLIPATAPAFAMFCRAVVLEKRLGNGPEAGGSNHRGMMQRVEAGNVRFSLAPIGKPIGKPKAVEDPFAEFDEAARG